MDTSTESDCDAQNNNTTATTTLNGCGPMTRKGWSDWCSPKCDKSSQSEYEENNNNFNGGRASAALQKKRKKLTRKAAIASKSAAAAAARDANNTKENFSKDDNVIARTAGGVGRKGRMKKGARGRKSLKIVGLDVLHKQTLLSTSVEVLSKKLPPAPGCVDQQLTSLLTGDMSHTELDIPTAPQNTPYALEILLDVFRQQYVSFIEQMKSHNYVPNIKRDIQSEQERKQRLKNRASQLDKQIKVLIDDSVALLKVRANELGINVSSPNDLIAKAKEIVGRHKELQGIAKKIQAQVTACEMEQRRLLHKNLQNFSSNETLCENKTKLDAPMDFSEKAAHDLVLREIAKTLAQRKKLYAQVTALESETSALEHATEERRTAAALLAQGTNIMLASSVICPATTSAANTVQPLQLTTTNRTQIASNNTAATTPTTTTTMNTPTSLIKTTKCPRRINNRDTRDNRVRTQEWPDVPDVAKIEESNPEVLAQKILETGRQIEAGKYTTTTKPEKPNNCYKRNVSAGGAALYADTTLMPAPLTRNNNAQQHSMATLTPATTTTTSTPPPRHNTILPKCELPGRKINVGVVSLQESPKVANFEHRLKSIITSVLNEDQEQRKQQKQQASSTAVLEITQMPKRSKHQTVVAQGLTHLNANTTISPVITPPLSTNNNSKPQHMSSTTVGVATNSYSTLSAHKYAIKDNNIYHASQNHNQLPHQQQQKHIPHVFINTSTAANLAIHKRRQTCSVESFEQFEQQLHQQQLHQQHLQQQQQQEFKTPNNSREHLLNDVETTSILPPPRSSSANSDTYYERLSVNRDADVTTTNSLQPPSRPSSNSSQPDYTQVSPAKMALRRHLSQEKLNQLHAAGSVAVAPTPLSTKTIGDLVIGEIERTLEISHQSIINAVVNINVAGERNVTNNNNNITNNFAEREKERDRYNERLVINTHVQRPERVNVRILEEHQQKQQQQQNANYTQNANNLATLAHVAYNHKLINASQSQANADSRNAVPLSMKMSNFHNSGETTARNYSVARQPVGSARGRDYQTVVLPRAEMKGCIEAYFNEDHLQQQQQQFKEHKPVKEQRSTNAVRNARMNGVNPPLEGKPYNLRPQRRQSYMF